MRVLWVESTQFRMTACAYDETNFRLQWWDMLQSGRCQRGYWKDDKVLMRFLTSHFCKNIGCLDDRNIWKDIPKSESESEDGKGKLACWWKWKSKVKMHSSWGENCLVKVEQKSESEDGTGKLSCWWKWKSKVKMHSS